MPINRESVPPPSIGKIGPYTVFMTPPSTPKQPPDPCPQVVLPPVLPPPQQFHKSAASTADDGTFLGFFKNALDKVHSAHSSLDNHMARWLGLNQSKYQWALDDYYETKGLGTKGTWSRCNGSLAYTNTVSSSVPYHKNLSNSSNLRALIYSGDHDMSVAHVGTQIWINSLNLTLYDTWKAWSVNGQVAGYTQEFINGDYTLDFTTVKGAGHVAPEYKPKECYEMFNRWFAYYPFAISS